MELLGAVESREFTQSLNNLIRSYSEKTEKIKFELNTLRSDFKHIKSLKIDNSNNFEQLENLKYEISNSLNKTDSYLVSCSNRLANFHLSNMEPSTRDKLKLDFLIMSKELSLKQEELKKLKDDLNRYENEKKKLDSVLDKSDKENNGLCIKESVAKKKLNDVRCELDGINKIINEKKAELENIPEPIIQSSENAGKFKRLKIKTNLRDKSFYNSEAETEDSQTKCDSPLYSTQDEISDLKRKKHLLSTEQNKLRNEIRALQTQNTLNKQSRKNTNQQESQILMRYFITSLVICVVIAYFI